MEPSKDLDEEDMKSLLTLKEQNDAQAQRMKDLTGTIAKLAVLTRN